jgi:hypothetical protein
MYPLISVLQVRQTRVEAHLDLIYSIDFMHDVFEVDLEVVQKISDWLAGSPDMEVVEFQRFFHLQMRIHRLLAIVLIKPILCHTPHIVQATDQCIILPSFPWIILLIIPTLLFYQIGFIVKIIFF